MPSRFHACLILMVGLPGAGKSTLARWLARRLPGSLHLESDRIRKELAGWDPSRPLPRDRYTPELHRMTFQTMEDRARKGLREGRVVIVDATFLKAAYREPFHAIARAEHRPFVGVYVTVDEATALRRLTSGGDPLRYSDADVAVYQAMRAEAELPPQDIPHITVDGRMHPDTAGSRILNAMGFRAIHPVG